MRLSERLYRWFLGLYPREFRDEYGQEMSLLFRARAEEGTLRLWIQVLGDLLFHAPREHWSMVKQDAGYALRSWRRSPAVPALAISALTLGMGANIAIFSVANTVLLRPLPLRAPADLVLVREMRTTEGAPEPSSASLPNYLSWKERAQSLELAAFSGQTLTWTQAEHPERLEALAPTASFLPVLGASLQTGRWFTTEEERMGQHRVAVLSHRLWRTRFGADSAVVGRDLILNGAPYHVIGVAAADFTVPTEPDVWVPQVVASDPARRGTRYLGVLGRVRPGFTRDQAQAEMTAIARQLEREFPNANANFSVALVPFAPSLVPAEVRAALVALLAAASVVLVIACANVANVLLTRASARRKEVAIRAALGAGASRITRQLLTESVLLSLISAALGVLASVAVLGAARRMLLDVVPRVAEAGLDTVVFAFALGLAIATGVCFGLAPVWHVLRARSISLLHASGRDDRAPARNRARTALVVGQVALTTLLLVGAGLLVQSLLRLQRVPVGINADSVLTAKLSLSRARLADGPAIARFLSQLTSDLGSVPGITAAGISSAIPLSPGAHTITRAAGEADPFLTCEWRLVDAGYFRTLHIPLVRGRLFGSQDGPDAPRVFVISEHTARALYGEGDPVGRRLRLENGRTGEVVGVVADVRMKHLAEPPERVVYMPPSQFGFFPLFNVAVRTAGAPEAVASTMRDRLKALDPNLAAYEIRTMQHWVDRNAALMRIRTVLVTSLGALAVLMGVIGIYGVMSYLVTLRRHEFGLRVALGAQPWVLPLAVVWHGLRLTMMGIVLGLAAAGLAMDRMRDLLYDVDPRDPSIFAGVALVVLVAALAALYLPARRAAHADPLTMLRAEC